MACVAAIIASFVAAGCTGPGVSGDNGGQPPSASETEPAPSSPITERMGEYDEFQFWSSGREIDVPGLSGSLGVRVFEPLQDMYDLGFVGIAPLEEYCIVAFSTTGADPEAGTLSLAILSRYNLTYEAYMVDVHPSEMSDALDDQREVCAGLEWPEEEGGSTDTAPYVA